MKTLFFNINLFHSDEKLIFFTVNELLVTNFSQVPKVSFIMDRYNSKP